MSKHFFRLSSAHRDPASSKEQSSKDQVSLLYELGLIGDPDKRTRKQEKGQGREQPGGVRSVPGSRSEKGMHHLICFHFSSIAFTPRSEDLSLLHIH